MQPWAEYITWLYITGAVLSTIGVMTKKAWPVVVILLILNWILLSHGIQVSKRYDRLVESYAHEIKDAKDRIELSEHNIVAMKKDIRIIIYGY